jgi:hypothetical protein
MITIAQIRSWNSCYERESPGTISRLAAGRIEFTLREILACAKNDRDRIWVVTRPGVLSESQRREWLARLVARALARVESPDPRSAAVVAALRGDQVTPAVRNAVANASANAAAAAASAYAATAAATAAAATANAAATATAYAAAYAAAAADAAYDAATAAAYAAYAAAYAYAATAYAAAYAAERASQISDALELAEKEVS